MKRLENFLKILKEENLDGFFTTSVPNITYLTGFTGDSSRLLVTPRKSMLITDGRYTEQAQKECTPEIEIFKWIANKRYASETYSFLISELMISTLGIEGNILSFSEYETLSGSFSGRIFSKSGLIETLRKRKEPEEIESLKIACNISDKALEKTIPFIREGISELELAAQLEYQLKMNGADNLSFDSIVLFGARTSLLHGKPGNTRLKKGDFILFDFGALYHGYHADISRTFVFGAACDQQKELYSIIQKAQEEAVAVLKPGIQVKVPDNEVRKVIPEKYIEYYYPGLGHGVGLEIHETPVLGRDYDAGIEENMVITIEPGIYIPGLGGIRIEDTILITQKDGESLSSFPRDLIIL